MLFMKLLKRFREEKLASKRFPLNMNVQFQMSTGLKIILSIILNHKRERMNLRFVQEIERI